VNRNNTKTIGKHGKLSKTTLQVHISTFGLVHLYGARKCVTCFVIHVENFHQLSVA